jgi:ABC-type transport system involved in cytochrome bd biosynthesis fused ATPase/permease subunit
MVMADSRAQLERRVEGLGLQRQVAEDMRPISGGDRERAEP